MTIKQMTPLTAETIFFDFTKIKKLPDDEDDRFLTVLARHPDMHCLRLSLCFSAMLVDNEAADTLRFDFE